MDHAHIPANLVAAHARVGTGSNLAFALRVVPRRVRRDMFVFYQFCRIVDDVADSGELQAEEKERQLQGWQEAVAGRRPLPCDLAAVLDRHRVPRALLAEIIEGVGSDVRPAPPSNFAALRAYCRKVAGAVGLAFNRIAGCASPASDRFAENLGLALQLTNILRDVREDALAGRIYLPADEMKCFGVRARDLGRPVATPELAALLAHQAGRAAACFRLVQDGPPAPDRRSLVAPDAMRLIYSRLLTRIQRSGCRVLEQRYRVPLPEKIFCVLRALAQP